MYRLLSYTDLPDLRAALKKLQAFAASYDWAVGIDFDKATDAIIHEANSGNALVVDGYLVMVAEVTPWYSRDKLLQEWLVLKLTNGDVSNVPTALTQVAAERGCSLVITADSSPISIVADAYKAAGFSTLTRSFYKRL
jgi:hypothetical protein